MNPEEVTINIDNKYTKKKVNPHEFKIENACLMKHDQMQMKILNCIVKYLNEFSNKANDEMKKGQHHCKVLLQICNAYEGSRTLDAETVNG